MSVCVFKCIYIYKYIGMYTTLFYYSKFPTLKFIFHVVFAVMLMSFLDLKRTFLISLSSNMFIFFM